jgi:hypothetical protein
MPVRSLSSRVFRWPDRAAVDRAAREAPRHPELLRLGYFGSYARGDWGVVSDLDLAAIVTESPRPWMHRSLDWSLEGLPVPAELVVYTEAEWEQMRAEGRRFAGTVETEAMWVFPGAGP